MQINENKPTQSHPDPAPVRKSPLLPTPPASERLSNNINNYKQHIPRPSTFNHSRNPTFTRPSPFYNRFHQQHIPGPSPSPFRLNVYSTFSGPVTMNSYSYYLQPHIPRPFHHQQIPLLPLPAFTGPYQQISGHLTHKNMLFTIPTTASATTLHCMKKEDRRYRLL